MRIQHNIMAMNAYRNLGMNNKSLSKNLEKLSSGYRINRAGDDAAGLAISEKMRSQIAGLDQAQKNAQSGINMIQTAEGALTEVHDMLNRMVTLATQAANGTYVPEDQLKIQSEINSLTEEIDRIATESNFNGQKLLDGSLGASGTAEISTTKGVAGSAEIPATKAKIEISLKDIDVAQNKSIKVGGTAVLTNSGGAAAKAQDLAAVGGNLTINGKTYTAAMDADSGVLTLTATDGGETTLSPGDFTVENDTSAITPEVKVENGKAKVDAVPGTAAKVEIDFTDLTGADAIGTTVKIGDKTYEFVATGGDATGTNVKVELGETATDEDIVDALKTKVDTDTAITNTFTVTDGGKKLTITETAGTPAGIDAPEVKLGSDSGLTLQIGASITEKITVNIDNMGAESLGIKGADGKAISVANVTDANAAIKTINDAIEMVSVQRSNLGAYQNRLEHTINNLGVMEENIQDAEATIRDTDIADEMMAYTKNNILIQSAQAMLAQANQVPQGVLQLMQ